MGLKYIEYHVTHHCNLNCKGCGHFSNLVKEPRFGNLEKFQADLVRLKDLIGEIDEIRLMGGEPLLNKECGKFVYVARKVFPRADLRLVTNGILFQNMEKKFFSILREYKCKVQVSVYEPVKPYIEKLRRICEEEQICLVETEISFFTKKADPEGGNNPYFSHKSCVSKGCTYLEDGKLSVCCAPQLAHLLANRFQIPFSVTDGDVIDLYDSQLTGEILLSRLDRPMQFCRYCVAKPQKYLWKSVGYNVADNDWIIDRD